MARASRMGAGMLERRSYAKSADAQNENGSPEKPPESRLALPRCRGSLLGAECAKSVLLRELDHLVKGRERLSAAHEVTIDGKRRRAAHARLGPDFGVLVDELLVLVAIEGRLELAHVDPTELLGILLEIGTLDRLLIGEQLVVILPERLVAALLEDFTRGLGRERSILVERERHVAPDHLHVLRVRLHDLFDGRRDAAAEGALEV